MQPQLIVTLGPDGGLRLEGPGKAGYRDVFEPATSPKKPSPLERQLLELLQAQQAEIAQRRAEQEAERQAERAGRRRPKQPDWRLIAKHPEAEIRESFQQVQVTQVPMAGGGKLTVQRSRKGLEEMGL